MCDRSTKPCEITISVILKIPIYIEAVVQEAPFICVSERAESPTSKAASGAVTSPPKLQPEHQQTPQLTLLASLSALLISGLTGLAFMRFCPNFVCFKAASHNEFKMGLLLGEKYLSVNRLQNIQSSRLVIHSARSALTT